MGKEGCSQFTGLSLCQCLLTLLPCFRMDHLHGCSPPGYICYSVGSPQATASFRSYPAAMVGLSTDCSVDSWSVPLLPVSALLRGLQEIPAEHLDNLFPLGARRAASCPFSSHTAEQHFGHLTMFISQWQRGSAVPCKGSAGAGWNQPHLVQGSVAQPLLRQASQQPPLLPCTPKLYKSINIILSLQVSDKIQNTKFWLPFLNCKIQEKPTRNIRLRYLAFLAVILK